MGVGTSKSVAVEAQKYAKTMLKLMTGRRTDLLAMKKRWLQAA